MTVTTIFPKKRTLHNRTIEQRTMLSIPFILNTEVIEAGKNIFVDIKFPWGAGLAGAEVTSICLNQEIKKPCSIFAQLLDTSGRVSSPPFTVAQVIDGHKPVNLMIPLQDTQKIRFIINISDQNSSLHPSLMGKLLLSSGGVSGGKKLKNKLTKWRSSADAFRQYCVDSKRK